MQDYSLDCLQFVLYSPLSPYRDEHSIQRFEIYLKMKISLWCFFVPLQLLTPEHKNRE